MTFQTNKLSSTVLGVLVLATPALAPLEAQSNNNNDQRVCHMMKERVTFDNTDGNNKYVNRYTDEYTHGFFIDKENKVFKVDGDVSECNYKYVGVVGPRKRVSTYGYEQWVISDNKLTRITSKLEGNVIKESNRVSYNPFRLVGNNNNKHRRLQYCKSQHQWELDNNGYRPQLGWIFSRCMNREMYQL